MSSKEKSGSLFPYLWENLSSLRLTIFLLLILAIVSIFGTIIPQNASPQEYLQVYKLSTYKILKILGFLDMYHAPWFFFLLALLSLNLIFCSWRRFRATWQSLTTPIPQDKGSWEQLCPRQFLLPGNNRDEILMKMKEIFSKFYPRLNIQEAQHMLFLSAEKGKLSRLGVYFIHISILVILLGALISFYGGFRGHINIKEGEKANKFFLRNGQEIFFPGFAIRLENFSVSFYSTGAPREFKSIISIFEDGQKIMSASILVNQPLTYKGLTFYQASYGIVGVKKVIFDLKDLKSGRSFTAPLFLGEESIIAENSLSVRLDRFLPDFQGLGPAFQITLSTAQSTPEKIWVFPNHPDFGSGKKGQRFQAQIKEWLPIYYSGLQVTKDPGVEIVWVGCSLMIVGFYLTFFLTHRRLWARLIKRKDGFCLEIVPFSNRERQGLEKEVEQIEQTLLKNSSVMSSDQKKKREKHD